MTDGDDSEAENGSDEEAPAEDDRTEEEVPPQDGDGSDEEVPPRDPDRDGEDVDREEWIEEEHENPDDREEG